MSCPTNCDLFSWSSRKKIAQGYDTAAAPSRLYARIMDPDVVGGGRPLGSVASQGASQAVVRWRNSDHWLRRTERSGGDCTVPGWTVGGQLVGRTEHGCGAAARGR